MSSIVNVHAQRVQAINELIEALVTVQKTQAEIEENKDVPFDYTGWSPKDRQMKEQLDRFMDRLNAEGLAKGWTPPPNRSLEYAGSSIELLKKVRDGIPITIEERSELAFMLEELNHHGGLDDLFPNAVERMQKLGVLLSDEMDDKFLDEKDERKWQEREKAGIKDDVVLIEEASAICGIPVASFRRLIENGAKVRVIWYNDIPLFWREHVEALAATLPPPLRSVIK